MAEAEFAAAVQRWINRLSEGDYRRFGAAFDELLASGPSAEEYPDDPEERLAIPLGGELRELVFFEGRNRRKRSLAYYVSPDRRVLFLTLFRLGAKRETEIQRARQALRRAVLDGHSVGNV